MAGMGNEIVFGAASESSERTPENQATGEQSISASAIELLRNWRDWVWGKKAEPAEPGKSTSLPELEIRGGTCGLPGNPNLEMGNPSNATRDLSNKNNYLVVKDQYVMSYSSDRKTPNWVSWQLNEDWLGRSGRTGNFRADDSLPASFEQATPNDYKNSGYDRGHNVPSGDRTRTREDNEATFYMSNITPQASDNNQGPWEKLESYTRELAKQGKEIYIIAGSDGSKGEIGDGVNVPEDFWKVVVILPEKGMGAKDVTAKTEVIAVEMPNKNGIRNDGWQKYLTTVSAIERHTGLDLLSCLPDDVEKAVSEKRYSGN